MSRRLPIVFLSVAAIMGAGLVAYKVTHKDDTAILSKPGQPATGKLPVAPKLDGKTLPNLTLVDFSGAKRSTQDLLGKPAVINVWQESCLPCKDEMPAFEKVHQTLGDRVRFVGMNPQDDPERATAFARKIGITYELWRDEAGEIYSSLKLTSLPSTILVNAVGRIVWSKSGPLTGEQLTAKINEVFPA
jgi:thiol-disulfide isomerase/thioredoxin